MAAEGASRGGAAAQATAAPAGGYANSARPVITFGFAANSELANAHSERVAATVAVISLALVARDHPHAASPSLRLRATLSDRFSTA